MEEILEGKLKKVEERKLIVGLKRRERKRNTTFGDLSTMVIYLGFDVPIVARNETQMGRRAGRADGGKPHVRIMVSRLLE